MRSAGRTKRTGFTLVELLVVISIIMVLTGIAVPIIANANRSAQRTECLSNVRQVGMAVMLYAEHNPQNPRKYYPYSGSGSTTLWATNVADFVEAGSSEGAFVCPSSKFKSTNTTYAVHAKLMPSAGQPRKSLDNVSRPAEIIMAGDACQGGAPYYAAAPSLNRVWSENAGLGTTGNLDKPINPGNDRDSGSYGNLRYRHTTSAGKGVNLVFFDGHALTMTKGELLYRNFDHVH